ncbi:MAG: hypothetical protein A3D87_05970 [Omnitrophica WOR_2 bacterium RIFCSPHIGHO2_02_FULL_50_17]|nr:MAG: hypothetical protein A3D87_05970 [Omnitrophica WOR_2 bacterium RIFCSPHIGHO2_02_FULL_50_17]
MNVDKRNRLERGKRIFLVFVLLIFCLTQSGCAILKVPLTLAKVPFSLLGHIMGVVNKLPKPPPWVFF